MLIDWFTVAAQIVNFLILIWLLKRFLYGPILRAMDRREERIRKRLQEAERKRAEAEEEGEEYRKKQRQLEEQTDELLREAQKEADDRREELVRKAREEAEEIRRNWLQEVEREQREFLNELRRRTGAEVIKVTRKALCELTDVDLGDRLAEVFLRRLKDLDDDERKAWQRETRDGAVQVHASFELDSGVKSQLTRGIHELCGEDVDVEYTVDEGDGFGVSLRTGDLRMEWGRESYLDGLERSLSELLEGVASEGEEPEEAGAVEEGSQEAPPEESPAEETSGGGERKRSPRGKGRKKGRKGEERAS